jgi:hypothetical protein
MRGVLLATWASLCDPFISYVDGLSVNYSGSIMGRPPQKGA